MYTPNLLMSNNQNKIYNLITWNKDYLEKNRELCKLMLWSWPASLTCRIYSELIYFKLSVHSTSL